MRNASRSIGKSIFGITGLVAVVLTGLIALAWYWSDHRAAPDSPAASGGKSRIPGSGKPQPVTLAEAKEADLQVWLHALGTVIPRNLVVVRTKVDGTLLKIHFREGDMVKAGDLLAEIDPRPFQALLDQARGQLQRDSALLENARLDLSRYKDLLKKDAIARQQVDTQEALVRQYQGSVEVDRAQVVSAKLQLDYTRIVAPAAGRAGLRQIDPGNEVHVADANGIVSIAQLQPITAIFAIPEANLPAIRQRLAKRAPIIIEAWDREQKKRLAEGRLLTTDNQIDPTTGTVRLKAVFANKELILFPNQFVNIRLLLDTLPQTLAVPSAAVLRGAKGSFVYRAGTDDTVAMVPVSAGAVDGDWQAVSGDLKAGDRVVIDGTDKLREGGKISPIAPKARENGKGGPGGGAGKDPTPGQTMHGPNKQKNKQDKRE